MFADAQAQAMVFADISMKQKQEQQCILIPNDETKPTH